MASNNFEIRAFLKASMQMAADSGWTNVTPTAVIQRMGLDDTDLPSDIQSKQDILQLFENELMKDLKDQIDEGFEDESIRDRLFEILMERFDLMIPYREGLKSILYSLPLNPSTFLKSSLPFRDTMKQIFEMAGGSIDCPLSELKLIGLSVIYLKTCRIWFNDETNDLSKTMAELDQNLKFAEQLNNSIGL